jgi:predicted AAA+ superfamily ATPase
VEYAYRKFKCYFPHNPLVLISPPVILLDSSATMAKVAECCRIRIKCGCPGFSPMDYTSLANDVGVSAKTIKHWLSILEASFVVYKLPSYFENFGKRVVKSPKYYFFDTGLLAFMLGIERASQVSRDPLLGHIFENMVVIECLKTRTNAGKLPNLYFFRDSNGNEVDILFQNR